MEFQEKFIIDKSNGTYFGSKVDIMILGGLNPHDERNSQSLYLMNEGFHGIKIFLSTNSEQNIFSFISERLKNG